MALRSDLEELYALLNERDRRKAGRKIEEYYPNEGPLRRELYPKHIAFFKAGKKCRQRCFIAANRVGKTEGVGLFELELHVTGAYPEWWVGRRFERPIVAWVAGDTSKSVRDILQAKFLGRPGAWGTGLLPQDALIRATRKPGLSDAVDVLYVKHKSGGTSQVTFKSYDQRRESFQGTEIDVILLDEEPPHDIYEECVVRTMTNGGLIMLTFTPLQGMSEVVLSFMENGGVEDVEQANENSKFWISASWDDVPHLTKEAKEELWAAIAPHQRDARSKGIPALGSGAIYPISEDEILCDPFKVPELWPRCFALDVGWNKTAALWGAWDRDNDTVYLTSEYYRGQAEPAVHASRIRGPGNCDAWIPGVIDPAARGRSQVDGFKLIDMYTDEGLNLTAAQNAVETGIQLVWKRLSEGRLKVFRTNNNWLDEFRLYHRDTSGKVVKKKDHLMDTTRYLVMSGLDVASVKIDKPSEIPFYMRYDRTRAGDQGWMRN